MWQVVVHGEGWERHEFGGSTLWFKGFLHNRTDFFLKLRAISQPRYDEAKDAFTALLREADGQFALIWADEGVAVAACDRMRSHPILHAAQEKMVHLAGNGLLLKELLHLEEPDRKATLCVGMSGYGYEDHTLYAGLKLVRAGEAVFFDLGRGRKESAHYYAYSPWRRRSGRTPAEAKRRLAELTLRALEKMVSSVDGRTLCLSLSAGMDSRTIVSGLSALGCKKVKCFSYGLPNNFEAAAGKKIAARLGYEWFFVRTTPKIMKGAFQSDAYADYLRFADMCAATPSVHEFYAVQTLKEAGFVADDTVFVNGFSGDFIVGGHVASIFFDAENFDLAARQERMLHFIVEKHYSLWKALKTPAHLAALKEIVREQLAGLFASAEAGQGGNDYAFYEHFEWKNRQTLFAMNMPRVYEFWGHAWRFPLWERDFVDFWEEAPLAWKYNRALFREMLMENNWGNVWDGFHCPRYNSPRPLAWLRQLVKIALFPWGRERWHGVHNRHFAYWMEILCYLACVDPAALRVDTRGYRNALSWLTEEYLEKHGVHWLLKEEGV